MPGGGMSMWPPPFLGLTITDQGWLGVLRVHSKEVCWFWAGGMITRFLEKLLCRKLYAIRPSKRKLGFEKRIGLKVFLGPRGPHYEEQTHGPRNR
jgi:hypothetical protein